MKSTLLIGLILWPVALWAQTPADACRCSQVLNQVSQKATTNYAGWFDKVNPKTKPAYTRLLDSLQTLAAQTTTDTGCFSLLKRYKAFFRDGHFQVVMQSPTSGKPPVLRRLELTQAQAEKLLADRGNSRNPIEGIWETPEHSYKLAIVPDPQQTGALVGVVLAATNTKWVPGVIKMELAASTGNTYRAQYRNADFAAESVEVKQTGNLFQVSSYGTWMRLYPQAATADERLALERSQSPIEFRQINPQVAYLRVSNFNVPKAQVDSLVAANRPALRRTPTLIIDIRNNFGGSNSSFSSLLPLMNTNNFQDIHSYMRTSPDNLAAEEALLTQARAKKWDVDSVLNAWAADIAKARTHPDQLYRLEGELIRIDSVLTNPARVAVLMNDKCYSSAEYFAFYAKQSRKTTLFGQHTGGVMDYGNVRKQELSCPQFVLRLPTTRSGWVDTIPIDNVGFQPDVPIPASETDWVNYVVQYYARRPTTTKK